LSCSTRPCWTIPASSVARCSGTRAHNEAFFIPKSFGTSIALTGGPQAALIVFIGFYMTCIVATWFFYTRRGAEIRC
jgi:NNP family nitrate/nitrite transporter-like MFS transporter